MFFFPPRSGFVTGAISPLNSSPGTIPTVQPSPSFPILKIPGNWEGKTIAVPFWYSIHNLVLQQLLQRNGLKIVRKAEGRRSSNEVNLVVLPPQQYVTEPGQHKTITYCYSPPASDLAECKRMHPSQTLPPWVHCSLKSFSTWATPHCRGYCPGYPN
jgi:ABC-type nitrate/sulfonate/bicarbonate transport system substrate-binding protein